MKGLLFYDNCLYCLHGAHYCNICGKKIKDGKAWVYREGDIILTFCTDGGACLNKFLELNKLQDVGGEDEE